MITLYHPYSVSPLQAEYDTVTPKTKMKSINQKQSGFCAKPYLYKHNILHLFTWWQCFSSYINDMVHLSGQCEELSPSHNAKKQQSAKPSCVTANARAIYSQCTLAKQYYYYGTNNNRHFLEDMFCLVSIMTLFYFF